MFQEAINIAVQYGDSNYAAQLQTQRTNYSHIVSQFSSNKNTISVTASASGSGNFFDQTGASVHGKVRLHLKCIGTPALVQRLSLAAIRHYARVRFTNKTTGTVSFFLSGVAGLNAQLPPNFVEGFRVVIDPGTQPHVGIHQPDGTTLNFSIADNGDYAFILQNGKIVNAFSHLH